MSNFMKGALSLIAPRHKAPTYLTEREIEEKVWRDVGSFLRDAMTTYGETEEYQEALAKKTKAKKTAMAESPNQTAKDAVPVFRAERQVAHGGPSPTPLDLTEYDKILPGFAERITRMAEEQRKHISELQEREQSYYRKGVRRGQYMALILGLVGFVCVWALNPSSAGQAGIILLAFVGIAAILAQFLKK